MNTEFQNTSHLRGVALDYAVAKAAKVPLVTCTDGAIALSACGRLMVADIHWTRWQPSRDWAQAGPLIEKNGIYVMPGCGTSKANLLQWDARIDDPEGEPWETAGATPLEAAMRCLAYAELGIEAEIPVQLCE